MTNFERITSDPAVMNGQACVRGTRLTVKRVLLALAQYPDRHEFFKDYPQLQEDDLRQALEHAAATRESVK